MYPENPEGTQVIIGSMNMNLLAMLEKKRYDKMDRPMWRNEWGFDWWHNTYGYSWKSEIL